MNHLKELFLPGFDDEFTLTFILLWKGMIYNLLSRFLKEIKLQKVVTSRKFKFEFDLNIKLRFSLLFRSI